MDLLPFHPKVVHLPIALAILMPLLSAGLFAAWQRNVLPRRAWAIAALLQALLVGSGVVAIQSGEAEEDRAERVVAEKLIEAHAEAAEAFVWGAGAILLLHLAALAVRNEKSAQAAALAATLGTLLVLVLGYRAGEAGGELVYRHGAAGAYTASASAAAPQADDD